MPGVIYLATLAAVGSVAIEIWRDTRQRDHLWELYALRDRLRALAIEDPTVASSPAFHFLDTRLTEFCTCSRHGFMSLWHAVAGMLISRGRPAREPSVSGIEQCRGDRRLEAIHKEAMSSVGGLLFWRHIALFALVLPTIVLPIFFWTNRAKVARYMFVHTSRQELRTSNRFVVT